MGKKSLITVATAVAIGAATYAFWPETKEACYKKAAATAITNPAFFALRNLCDDQHTRELSDAEVFGSAKATAKPVGMSADEFLDRTHNPTAKEFTGKLDPVQQR